MVRLEGFAIQEAILPAYRDQAHRMEHWVTWLTLSIASCSSSSTDSADKQKIVRLEKNDGRFGKSLLAFFTPSYSHGIADEQPQGKDKGNKSKRGKSKGSKRSGFTRTDHGQAGSEQSRLSCRHWKGHLLQLP